MIKTSRQLKDKVRNMTVGLSVREKSEKSQMLIRNYLMERLLERISVSNYRDNFILKGGIDKIIARLADSLKGVIDIAHFNDEAKIGKGQEMVDKLTKLIAIFQRPELNFSNNKADGDDIIGDGENNIIYLFSLIHKGTDLTLKAIR